MNKDSLFARMPPGLRRLAEPTALHGEDIALVPEQFGLHLTEIGMGLGINTAALYGKKATPAKINSTVAILLRLYAAFPEFIPRIEPPEPEALFNLISELDPKFKTYYLGPLLGLETNSSYRINREGFTGCAQTTRALAALIYRLLRVDPSNFSLIREAVELEAQASGISPASEIWKRGGWKQRSSLKNEDTGSEKQVRKRSVKSKSAPAPTVTTKKPVRRKP